MDSTGSDRPQRRTALVDKELERYRIQIAALSEALFADVGEIKEVGAGYTFFWSGPSKVKRGVKQKLALPLKQNLLESFQDCQKALMPA